MTRTTKTKMLAERCVQLVRDRIRDASPYRHDEHEIREALQAAHFAIAPDPKAHPIVWLRQKRFRRRIVRRAIALLVGRV